METATKHAFRVLGPVTVSTGVEGNGGVATVEVAIRRDRLPQGEHAEDLQLLIARTVVELLEKRYRPGKG